MTARKVIFSGRVQNVGFRYTVRELAKGFEVTGTVGNLPDGTVEMFAEGEEEEIEELIKEIAEESEVAHHVKSVAVQPVEARKTQGFRIL